jgi:hypothetical protein
MGTGVTTLLWYGACGGVVLLTIVVGAGLFMWGTRREKRNRPKLPPS